MTKRDWIEFLAACGDAGVGRRTVQASRQKKAVKVAKKQAKRKQHQTQNLIIAHGVAKSFNNLLK